METVDISTFSLLLAFILLLIPVLLSRFYGLGLIGDLLSSVARMSVQLLLIGVFLKYLFVWNNGLVNLSWLAVMILVAVFSAIRSSAMKPVKVLVPIFVAFSAATFVIVFYLNYFVIKLDDVFDARYLIVLGGMLLGNSLRGNIVGIDHFYRSIRKDTKKYLYVLSLGATHHEALLTYLRESVRLALKPTIAAMATMGIVSLPGMMTGVILGGTSPEVAIKYQIMIMIGIAASTTISVVLTIIMTLPVCFTKYGTLKNDIFVSGSI
ncbi:MAG: ABC transporter ATP-binding protein [Planctomycetes bacterium GWF2_41_51]|nr:MAG: ABC transporter ATP-binding protein [Planctomycetes bacterium GWF2_41_51]